MPNAENIIGKGFEKYPERINRNGRPKKYITTIKEQGYKLSEINDTIQVLLVLTEKQLNEVAGNNDSTVLEKTISKALLKSLKNSSLYSLETLLSRSFGKPRETIDQSNNLSGEIKVTLKLDSELKTNEKHNNI